MTDEPTNPDTPTPEPGVPEPDDRRDERLAALLAVPPLDDVTRRRMVRTAVAAAAGPRSRLGLALPVAAAIVVGLVVGALVVTGPEEETTTAGRPEAASTEAPAQRSPAPEDSEQGVPAAPNLETAAAPITDLGALGDVGTEDRLATAVAAAQERARRAAARTPAAPGCASASPADLGLAIVAEAGTGTVGDQAVTVVVGTDTDGRAVAVALRDADCSEVLRAPLIDG